MSRVVDPRRDLAAFSEVQEERCERTSEYVLALTRSETLNTPAEEEKLGGHR